MRAPMRFSSRGMPHAATQGVTTQVDSNSGGTPLVTFVDSYDSVGNRTGRIHSGVVTTWVYDSIYRLTGQEKSGQAATFVYDDAGNLTVKWQEGSSPLTMSYDAGNRLTTSLLGSRQIAALHEAIAGSDSPCGGLPL